MAERDFVQAGQYYSADYLRQCRLDESETFKSMYKFVRNNTKTAQTAGVINAGASDTSPVFRVAEIHPDTKDAAIEYADSQTGTTLIAAPGAGKRIVAIQASMRQEGTTGIGYFHSTSKPLVGKVYFSVQTSFAASDVVVKFGENEAVLFTSTQGAKKLYVFAQYYIEAI